MEKKKVSQKNKSLNLEKGTISYRVLVEPWVTEEATRLMELNKYVFKVSSSSNKKEIKEAILETYGVDTVKVNIVNIPSKFRIQGRTRGWKSGFKKAIITLKEGDRIDFYN